MLHEATLSGDLVVYRSPLLTQAGVIHAFSTRQGGVSPAPFDQLNLGLEGSSDHGPADSPDYIAQNYQLLFDALGLPPAARAWVRQIHGSDICIVDRPALPAQPVAADALISDQPGIGLTIRVADCVPILLSSSTGQVVAAIHAGWRGLVAGIVPATIQTLGERFAVPPQDLLAAIGPCISVARFEVGPEVAQAFEQAGLAATVDRGRGPKPHVDLQTAVRTQLLRAGVPDQAIDGNDLCTFADADRFYSHRRDQGVTGRMAAVIGIAAKG